MAYSHSASSGIFILSLISDITDVSGGLGLISRLSKAAQAQRGKAALFHFSLVQLIS